MSTVENVLNNAIVLHITGNANGGGVHDGLNLSLNTGSFLDALGLELSRGEKTRLFKLMNSMKIPTKTEGRADTILPGIFVRKAAGKTDAMKEGNVMIRDSRILSRTDNWNK